MTAEQDRLKEHDFDGIQEFDNDLPRWWVWLFIITIIWSVLYLAHYHLGPGKVGVEELQADQAALAELRAKNSTGPLTEEQLRGLSASPERIARGAKLYASAGCTTCHGPEGLGSVGPNLFDQWWLFGSDMSAMHEVISKGKGQMPAQRLSPDEITDLVVWIVAGNRKGAKAGRPHDPAREREVPITY